MSSNKRKRKVLTIEEKLKAIERLNRGERIVEVASDLGVGVTTVAEWRHKKEYFENWCTKYATNEHCRNRKSIKDGTYEEISEALFRWFRERKDKNKRVDSQILKDKALEFHKELQEDAQETKKFYASDGWLNRWKERYGLKPKSVRGKYKKRNREKKIKPKSRLEDVDLRKIRGDDASDEEKLEEEYEEEEVETVVSHRGAVCAFDTAILYLEQQNDAAASIEIALLRRLRDIAALKENAARSKHE